LIAGPVSAQQSTTGPVPPPGLDPGWRTPVRAQVVIPDVPSYIWHHGCGPTALGMVVGYWDALGFPDLVAGSAVTQTAAVNAMIADDSGQAVCSQPDGDHYQDYSCPIDNAPGPLEPDRSELGGAHASNCLGDFMATSFSSRNNYYGWSWFADVDDAFEDYVAMISPEYVATTLSRSFSAFPWADYKAEIDAGRPPVLLVDTDGDGSTDHFVTGIGYDDTALEYGIYNTWDHSIHWYDWSGLSSGNPWGVYGVITCALSDPQFACCIGETCEILSEADCLLAGGIWIENHASCSPNPCADYACCFGDESCQVLYYDDCVALGGSWQAGIETCDPNPCQTFACCIASECHLRTMRACLLAGGEWMLGIETCDDTLLCLPEAEDLTGGMLITHAPPAMAYTDGENWCRRYAEEAAITNSYQQVCRIDPGLEDPAPVWYVLAAWGAPKEWCRATFGFDHYDPISYAFLDWGPCSQHGVEAPGTGWPGPDAGTAVLAGERWSGNYEPLYWFAGYAYEPGQLPLCSYEYAGESGLTNCGGMTFAPDCYGALGLFMPGLACHPEGQIFACCIGEVCEVLYEDDCRAAGGVWMTGTESCSPDPCSMQGLPAERPGAAPARLAAIVPNPFWRTARIEYAVPPSSAGAPLQLSIHDAAGRLVRLLAHGAAVAGYHAAAWDGRGADGRSLPSGIYFCRLALGETVATRRLLRLQ
jgi:hypothetical protein